MFASGAVDMLDSKWDVDVNVSVGSSINLEHSTSGGLELGIRQPISKLKLRNSRVM